jgi:hypothetical protein
MQFQQKDKKLLHLIIKKFMKLYTYIKKSLKKSFPSKISIFFKVVEFKSNGLKMFISTLWYDNIYDYDFFTLKNVLPLNIYLG